ncbi:MAG: sugar phosphate nucleotidyltransferase [Pseudomonadota bacterium]|nr:sugar phosphate nucleotidyltransferase [Pseudomonadota bacterium]
MEVNDTCYALVLAGGSGTRLWPRSRRATPKHLCKIVDEQCTMLELTLARLDGLVPAARRIVITKASQADTIHKAVVDTGLAGQVLVEPCGRGTLAPIALTALHLQRLQPQATMFCFHADAMIEHTEELHRSMKLALTVAKLGYLVLQGAKPTRPEVGFDYLAPQQKLAGYDSVWHVNFLSCTSIDEAKKYLAAGYYWHTGIFTWQVSSFLQELQQHCPTIHRQLTSVALDSPSALASVYEKLPNISVDAGLLRKSSRCVFLPCRYGWMDIGSWQALDVVRQPDQQGNRLRGEALLLDCQNTTVDAQDTYVVAVGVKDMVVVSAGDVVLVCPKDQSQRVREVVARLRTEGKEDMI